MAFIRKDQVAAAVGCIDFFDANCQCGLLDRGDSDQVLGRLWQQSESIDEFYLQFAQLLRVFGGGYAFVEH